MKTLTLALFLLYASPVLAAPVYPPLIEGRYSQRVQIVPLPTNSEGVPLEAPTKSVGLFDTFNDAQVVCGPASNGQIVTLSYTLTPGSRVLITLVGRAFSELGCTGMASADSVDQSQHVFGRPSQVILLEATE